MPINAELTGVVVAVVSLIGTILTGAFQVYAQMFRDSRAQAATRQSIIAKYRDPILLASNDLQSRLYFLVTDNLSTTIDTSLSHRDYIIYYTLFLFGQFFAWCQIMRYEIQFFDLESSSTRRALTSIMYEITSTLTADNPYPFRIWTGNQRAMGEVMVNIDHEGQRHCIGYAEFRKKLKDDDFKQWFTQPIADLELIARSPPGKNDKRLRRVQSLLVVFVKSLDPKGTQMGTLYKQLDSTDTSRMRKSSEKQTSKTGTREVV